MPKQQKTAPVEERQEDLAATETAPSGAQDSPVPETNAREEQKSELPKADTQKSDLTARNAELEKKVSSLAEEISSLKDQYLRKAADFENYRKRSIKEKQEAIDFANQSILVDLITVLDDFERAIKSSEASKNYDTFHEGIMMIENRLSSQLQSKWGLSRFVSSGKPFDPNRHEAIMMEKTPEVKEPTVGDDFQHGYELKERVIRSAKVKVLMPADKADGEATAPEEAPASGGETPASASSDVTG